MRHAAPPVLIMVFNRLEPTRQLMQSLAAARPAQLFVAADGPRLGYPRDPEQCAAVRRLATHVDWPCEVRTLFRPVNVGLQSAVISAISSFFEHVDHGVIFEDDCIPAPDFLPFASDVLRRYADDTRVMHVSGVNMAPERLPGRGSYHFATLGHIWGWATWRRAWQRFDPFLTHWPELAPRLRRDPNPVRAVAARKFAAMYEGRKATWSRAWYYTMVRHEGLAIIPSVNLVTNVGTGPDATHQHGRRHPLRRDVTGSLEWPLVHPASRHADANYDRLLAAYHRGSLRRRIEDAAWSLRRQTLHRS